MSFLVAAEPVLDRGTAGGELDTARGRVGAEQLDRLEQDVAAALELAA
jgi:hypothetical protein